MRLSHEIPFGARNHGGQGPDDLASEPGVGSGQDLGLPPRGRTQRPVEDRRGVQALAGLLYAEQVAVTPAAEPRSRPARQAVRARDPLGHAGLEQRGVRSRDQVGSGSAFAQQGREPGLLEVAVVGERLSDGALFHDEEARAVRQSPCLVGLRRISLQCGSELGVSLGDDYDICVAFQPLGQSHARCRKCSPALAIKLSILASTMCVVTILRVPSVAVIARARSWSRSRASSIATQYPASANTTVISVPSATAACWLSATSPLSAWLDDDRLVALLGGGCDGGLGYAVAGDPLVFPLAR